MAKYLDYPGLSYFWNKIKSWIRNYTHASYDQTTGRTTVVVDNITFDVSHKLPADYAPSTLENDALNPAANDSYDLAFSKIHKAIKDTERVTAEALTDLDSRTNELNELKAPKASPALTGTPTAPTAASGTNTTQIATTAFVQEAVNSGTGSVKVDGIKGSTINRYGVCSTAAATAAKTVNIATGTFPTLDASATGTRITIKFTNANTASTPTLNVNSKGAKGIYYKGTQITTDSSVLQGICDFIYDNANGWNLLENLDNTTGATNDASKLFIIGAKTQTTAPVTYSQTNVYMQNGKLYSGGKEVSTTDSITAADDLLDGSHEGDNTIKYAPYTTQQSKLSFDTSTTNPTRTGSGNRLNLNGDFYATKLYSGGTEVKVKQSAVSNPTASGHSASFIDTISQDANGVISVTKKYSNTTGSTDTSSKIFLVGATSQTDHPQTYSDDQVFVTNGDLSAGKFNSLTLTKNATGFSIGGGTTSKTLTVPESYTLGAACVKGVQTSATSTDDSVPTSKAVLDAIAAAQVGAAMFQGIIKSGTSLTALPTTGYKKGWYWIVGTAGTYAGQVCEVGDTIFCVKDYVSGSASNSDFNIVQNNIETITNSEIDSIESWPASS